MTTLRLPELWATNTNYAAGPDVGTPTRVAPGSNADGFARGQAAAAQHVNYLLNPLNTATRRLLAIAACKLRKQDITLDDTSGTVAVVSRGLEQPAIIGTMQTAGTPLIADSAPIREAGAIASITALVRDGAWNPTADRVVLVGSGGNRCCFSDDAGETWSAGGDTGGTMISCLWNPTYSRFVAVRSGNILFSTNSAAWTTVVVANAGDLGLGQLPSGDMLTATGAGPIAFSVSTNGGTSWVAAGGTVPNSTDFASNRGFAAGAGLDYIYHAGVRVDTDGLLQVSRTANAVSWSQTAELTPPSGATFIDTQHLRLAQCPDTGALWLTVGVDISGSGNADTVACYASFDQGVTWTQPLYAGSGTGVGATPPTGVRATHGKLWLADTAGVLYASDGIGSE